MGIIPAYQLCHDKNSDIAFRLLDLARDPTLWSMYLPGTVAAHLTLSVAPPPSQETHSVFQTGSPEGIPLYYCPYLDNPDSGVTVPLYSCAVPHAKKNELQAKPRAHVGVVWLR